MIVLTYLPTYIHVLCVCVFTFTFYLEQSVWVLYKLACDEAEIRAAEYTTFCSLWNKLVPKITVMNPMSDLCWVCQQNSRAIMRSANTPETEKSEVNNL